jgi:hypothetical protein
MSAAESSSGKEHEVAAIASMKVFHFGEVASKYLGCVKKTTPEQALHLRVQ